MKRLYVILSVLFFALLAAFGIWSAVDKDATVSVTENRTLADLPELSVSELADGSYQSDFETYYADTFPLRETFMACNRQMNSFYYYTGSVNSEENAVVLTNVTMDAEKGGVSLDAYTAAIGAPTADLPEEEPAQSDAEITDTDKVTEPDSGTADAAEAEIQEEELQEEEPVSEPAEADGELTVTDSTVIIVGDTAMDIPNATYSVIHDYAEAVNHIRDAMGDEIRVFSLLTPNSGQFYAPEEFRTGLHDQKEMIDTCYADMSDSILKVEAYSELLQHADEYIFFRTDHHWTARGAYYAYRAFCACAGMEPAELDDFATGQYDNFVGTMYTYTSGYAQSQALLDNPDYVEYFLPYVETDAWYYADADMEVAYPVSVVATKLGDEVSNKYLCFVGGDTPVLTIDTDVGNGKTCLILKESYGNAFIPFLTSHYSRIIAIDPREFNRDGKPSLDLVAFAEAQQVDDLIVLDYPFMINNSYYVAWLNRLVGWEE